MALIDLIRALRAAERGEPNTELGIMGKVIGRDAAPISSFISKKTGMINKISGSAKKGIASVIIGASLLTAPAQAHAWSFDTHRKTADILGITNREALTHADRVRTFPHFVNYPFSYDPATKKMVPSAELKKGVSNIFTASEADALHVLADYAQPLHAYPYNSWNKAHHKYFDDILNGKPIVGSGFKLKAATGDLRKNIENLVMDSNRVATGLEASNRVITVEEAQKRLEKALPIMQEYREQFAANYKNRVPTGKGLDILEANKQLEYETDYIARMFPGTPEQIANRSALLKETAIHESFELRYHRQVYKGKQTSVGRSIYMLEGTGKKSSHTINNLVKDWAGKKDPEGMGSLLKTFWMSKEELLEMSESRLSDIVMRNDLFATALTNLKYRSRRIEPSGTMEGRASQWGKIYQGTNDPDKIKQYIDHNKEWSRKVSEAMKRNVKGTRGVVASADMAKIGSKAGNATTKGVATMKKAIRSLFK